MQVENFALGAFALLPALLGVAVWCFFRLRRVPRSEGVPPANDSGPVELMIGNVLVLALLLSLVLPVGEAYYRWFYATTESFGFSKVGRDWYREHFHKNESGFRDSLAEYHLEPSAGVRRISFLGDSFTAGQGVPDVDDRFANRVRALLPGMEVHALADNGWNTAVEQSKLDEIARAGYRLDRVVLVYVLNDAADLVPEWQESVKRLATSRDEPFLVEASYLINTFYYRWQAVYDPEISSYYDLMLSSYEGPLWEEQKRRLEALATSIEGRGGSLQVVTFPFLNLLGEEYPYRSVHQQLDAFWKAEGVPHLDLLEVYSPLDPGDLVVNSFDAHPNERAHEIAARAIVRFLEAD